MCIHERSYGDCSHDETLGLKLMNGPAFLSLISGIVFGAGLVVSGMADPKRVRDFLDIMGAFDPTLAFVMGGAVTVMVIVWRVQNRMRSPLATEKFDLPKIVPVDRRLILGASIFGVGWGIAGLCPGPALAGLVIVPEKAIIFVTAMVIGMGLYRFIDARF